MVENNKVEVGQSYEDYLMKRGKMYEQKRQEEQEKREMTDPDGIECTFQPAVSGRKPAESHNPNSSRFGQNSGNKWDQLYMQAERKRGKADRTADEVEYERNQHELRFAPEVHDVRRMQAT